jgi:gas vesicle protein
MVGMSIIGLGLGLLAGVAAGLLMAPMRGSQMRQSLRERADQARHRGMALLEEGRRAFRETRASGETGPLTATLGDIARTHSGRDVAGDEGRS